MTLHLLPIILFGCKLFFTWQVFKLLFAFFFMPTLHPEMDEPKTYIFILIMLTFVLMLFAPGTIWHLLMQINVSWK